MPVTASVISLTATRCTFRNFTTAGINAASTTRLNLTMTDCTLTAGAAAGGVVLSSYVAGNIVISGGSTTITSQNTASLAGGIFVSGSTVGTGTFSCTNHSVAITLDPSLTSSGVHYGIRALNMANSVVDGGTHTISGTPGSRQAANVIIDYNGTGSISGSQIKNATGTNSTNGGYNFGFGLESAGTPSQANGCSITNCTTSAGAVAVAGDVHALFMGFTQNGTVSGNTIGDSGTAIVDKDSTGTTVTLNTISGAMSVAGLLMKGSTNCTHSSNAVTLTSGTNVILMRIEADGGTNSTGCAWTANTFTVAGGTGAAYVVQDTSQTATPTSNIYNKSSGTLASHPWQRTGVNYDTLSAWKAIEPSATGNAP